MKRDNFKRNIMIKLLLLLLIPIGMLLFRLTAHIPGIMDKFYSNGFFKFTGQALSLITGIVPFSVAEIGLIVLVILIPVLVIATIVKIIRQRSGKLLTLFGFLLNAAVAVSLVYFILVFFWTLNYNRQPFSQIASLDVKPASVSELSDLCKDLIGQANRQRLSVHTDSAGIMSLPYNNSVMFKKAFDGYKEVAKIYPTLGGKYGKPKNVLLSKWMSYTGIIGIYCPFTGEANVDTDIPDFNIPSTVCHEMAHQRGFAREDEANYISYVTCNLNPDVNFQYSGTMLALIYSMNALYDHDRDTFNQLRKEYSDGVNRDLSNDNQYWRRHEGKVEKITNSLNDSYLKANDQKDGVYSYGRMVDLLLAEHRKK